MVPVGVCSGVLGRTDGGALSFQMWAWDYLASSNGNEGRHAISAGTQKEPGLIPSKVKVNARFRYMSNPVCIPSLFV